MPWYEHIKNILKYERTYSYKDLKNELKSIRPNLSEGSYQWAISSLVRDGDIIRLGYNEYSRSDRPPKKEYYPLYSGLASELKNNIHDRYPYIVFTVFETVLMNDFLNHLIAQNTIFIQVEKESSIFVFRYLQDSGYRNILYRPTENEIDLYWSKDAIVVTNLISEAPLRSDDPHTIMLEKMLVDMIADKLIRSTYSKAELPDVFQQVQDRYYLDRIRLLRYARRRNRENEIKHYLEGSTVESVAT